MFKLLLVALVLNTFIYAELVNYKIEPTSINKKTKINILDSKELKFKNLDEISALAMKENILYALSDKGELFTFKIKISKDKIKKLKLLESNKLKDKNSKKLSKKDSDSEGMIIVDNKLYISFEKNHRIEVYSLDGKKIKKLQLNKKLNDKNNYKSENKGLEALAYNKKYALVTAPEIPKKNKKYHTLYAKNKKWMFELSGDIKGLEFINNDELLLMQRDYNEKKSEMNIIFNTINLSQCGGEKICKNNILAKLKTKNGWRLYNFEGLTKVDKNRFLMVSDNHGEKSQKTLLVLFEIK